MGGGPPSCLGFDTRHHGVGGLSPYEIAFGRQRPLACLPYEPPKECENAKTFFRRMDNLGKRIAEVFNLEHLREANRLNALHKSMEPLQAGDKVWYKRPENTGDKMSPR